MLPVIGSAFAAVSSQLRKRTTGQGQARQHGEPALQVSGQVAGLFPGARRRLQVRIHNRSPRTVTVRSVSVRVRSPRRGCPRAALRIGRFHGRLVLRGHSSRRIALPVALRAKAPDACQRVRFPLRFFAGV
jgi:hypothetical protein